MLSSHRGARPQKREMLSRGFFSFSRECRRDEEPQGRWDAGGGRWGRRRGRALPQQRAQARRDAARAKRGPLSKTSACASRETPPTHFGEDSQEEVIRHTQRKSASQLVSSQGLEEEDSPQRQTQRRKNGAMEEKGMCGSVAGYNPPRGRKPVETSTRQARRLHGLSPRPRSARGRGLCFAGAVL